MSPSPFMRLSQPVFLHRRILVFAAACLVGGCADGPQYQRPSAAEPAVYKEAQGWSPAAPADALNRGQWWTLFNDPVLNQLAASVQVSNQNVAAAAAAYAQARAFVSQQRAAMFPVVSLDGSAHRTGGAGRNSSGNNFALNLGTTWEPDVWGRLS